MVIVHLFGELKKARVCLALNYFMTCAKLYIKWLVCYHLKGFLQILNDVVNVLCADR